MANAGGTPERQQSIHDRWILATQDCDLDLTENTVNEPTIELRPMFNAGPPPEVGIRSAKFLLPNGEYVVATSPRTHVSAALLSAVSSQPTGVPDALPDHWVIAFKTWLGLRYDRPAVPPELLGLADRIALEVARKRRRPTGALARDVLMQFDDTVDPTRFSLYAVIGSDQDEPIVREWLADIAQAIPLDLGVGDVLEAVTSHRVSLTLVETSYAADVTQLTWDEAGLLRQSDSAALPLDSGRWAPDPSPAGHPLSTMWSIRPQPASSRPGVGSTRPSQNHGPKRGAAKVSPKPAVS